MPILKNLTFTAVPARSHDPVANRRAKLDRAPGGAEGAARRRRPTSARSSAGPARATSAGRSRSSSGSGPGGAPTPRGNVVMSVYYGTKPIEFEKGKAGIAVASRDKLPALIDALIGAAKAGELDDLLAPRASRWARPRPDARPEHRSRHGRPHASPVPISHSGHNRHGQTTRPAPGHVRAGRRPSPVAGPARLPRRPVAGPPRRARRGRARACPSAWACAPRSWPASGGPTSTTEDGRVRAVVHLQGGLHQGRQDARRVRVVARAAARAGEVRRARLAAEREGVAGARCSPARRAAPMTACSMARFLKALYAEAGIAGASSHSGRRTLITRLAERGDRPEGDRGDRGPHLDPHDGDVRRGQPDAARAHPAGRDVLSFGGPRNVRFRTIADKRWCLARLRFVRL